MIVLQQIIQIKTSEEGSSFTSHSHKIRFLKAIHKAQPVWCKQLDDAMEFITLEEAEKFLDECEGKAIFLPQGLEVVIFGRQENK